MSQATERQVRSALPLLRLCWSLLLAAVLALAGLGGLAAPAAAPQDGASAGPLGAAAVVLGLTCALATLWLDRRILAPHRIALLLQVPDLALARRHLLAGHLALWALAAVPALLGFAQLLLDGRLAAHLALCAVSLAVLALLLPTRARVGARLGAAAR